MLSREEIELLLIPSELAIVSITEFVCCRTAPYNVTAGAHETLRYVSAAELAGEVVQDVAIACLLVDQTHQLIVTAGRVGHLCCSEK